MATDTSPPPALDTTADASPPAAADAAGAPSPDAPGDGAVPGAGKPVSAADIQTVQNLIERCLQLYMSQREAVFTLQARARVDPAFTALVWAKLEDQNAPFFRAYYTRLKLKDQIVLFNHLLEQQVAVAAARAGGAGANGGAANGGDWPGAPLDTDDGLPAPPPPPAGFGGGGLPRPPSTASLGDLDLAAELAAARAAGGGGSGAATPQGLPRNFSLSDLAFDVGGDGDSVA